MLTIIFEDRGQDFREWDIQDGMVVGCRPKQAACAASCRQRRRCTARRQGEPAFTTRAQMVTTLSAVEMRRAQSDPSIRVALRLARSSSDTARAPAQGIQT